MLPLVPLAASQLLAYTPFLQPLDVDAYWLWFIAPLALAIAIVYKTIKLRDLTALPRQSAMLACQIVFLMALAAAVLWVLTEIV